MTPADISIVIPVYNRGDLIHYTMESVRRASRGLAVETLVVDDGSDRPVAEDLARLGYADGGRVIRQSNQGLLFARLAGLAAATGRHLLFLDSDDLLSEGKLRAQVAAMDAARCDVSYTDTARATLAGDLDAIAITHDAPLRATTDAADFFINVQPAPHSPVFRTAYLREVVRTAWFPPSPLYNCVAEIWFYHNAAPSSARIVHVAGAPAIIGQHADARLTNHWEKLGVASLGVMESFARSVPATPEHARVLRLVGEKAFAAWRRLPRGFSPVFEDRMLDVWSRLTAGHRDGAALGGRAFQLTSRLLGPVQAGRLFRRWQNQDYASCRTLSDGEFSALLAQLPPPR